jgi:PcRGLX-like N-terminal RIFT barrel domain
MKSYLCCLLSFAAILSGTAILANPPKSLGLNNQILKALQPLKLKKSKRRGKLAPDFKTVEVAHIGEDCILIKLTMSRPLVTKGSVVVYLNLDNNLKTGRKDGKTHMGVDMMGMFTGSRMSKRTIGLNNANTIGIIDKETLWMLIKAPLLVKNNKVIIKMHLASQEPGKRSQFIRPAIYTFPVNKKLKPPTIIKLSTASKSHKRIKRIDLDLKQCRFHTARVKYLPLKNKGLKGTDVKPANPIKFGRPCPKPIFNTNLNQNRKGSTAYKIVPVELLEEAGISRSADVRFGFPLPQGAIYDLKNFQVFAPNGKKVAAQFSATGFWPDKSLKWVLIQFKTKLKGKEKAIYKVLFGTNVRTYKVKTNLKIASSGKKIIVNTGTLKVQLGNNLINKVWYKNNLLGGFSPDGITLIDEKGRRFTTGASSPQIKIEESGPEYSVVRLEGHYKSKTGEKYMKYIARLTFRNNSSIVGLTLTHLNDYTATEFTDITSLTLPFIPAKVFKQAKIGLTKNRTRTISKQQRGFQLDDLNVMISGKQSKDRMTGAATLEGSNKITLAWQDFHRRWPKAYQVADKKFVLEILPEQPNKDYGKNLPFYLMFPFCEGKYRFKWGMSFTERIRFDFSGSVSSDELQAELDTPVVAVLPAAWYAKTKAFPNTTVPQQKQFSAWDNFINKYFKAHMTLKYRQREFGYFNYGDWYGERGRNWGNNEYDLAHGLFAAFVRTGNRDYYRWAMQAARHQADVDIVHAYPNPYYLGANHQHSIGHTGVWSQVSKHATWTHPYDSHTSAQNGHTWSKGMLEAWMLSGDPVVMEAALKLGEHIIWAMAPSFTHLGNHERTAGWSIKAVMPFYTLTNDPLYLKAAKQIAAVALREQKANGAWAHRLPASHAGGAKNAIGNNLFLLGILTSSMKDYHQSTGDPKMKKALLAAVDWMCKSYNSKTGTWPYSASILGKPHGGSYPSLNMLIVDSIAYAGKITGKKKYIDIARNAVVTRIMAGPSADGKSMAMTMVFTDSIMKSLQDYYAKHDKKYGENIVSKEKIAKRSNRIPDTNKFNVRGPNTKTFYIKLKKPQVTIILNRKKHGSRPSGWDKCFGDVYNSQGKKIDSFEYAPSAVISRKVKLSGKPGATFKVVFRDDFRGIWDITGKGIQVMLKLVPGTTLGNPAIARFYLTVPQGTKQFEVRIQGVHTGSYGMLVMRPDGKIVKLVDGINAGKCQLPWTTGFVDLKSASTTIIKVPKGQDGKIWPLAIWGAGDIGLQVKGIPPYLTRRKESAFSIKP